MFLRVRIDADSNYFIWNMKISAVRMKYILILIIVLLFAGSSSADAYTHSDGCGSVCFGTCDDYSHTPMPAAKCAPMDPASQSICKVMFGDCARLENGECGWKSNVNYQTCTDNPVSYRQQYLQWQENLVRERIAANKSINGQQAIALAKDVTKEACNANTYKGCTFKVSRVDGGWDIAASVIHSFDEQGNSRYMPEGYIFVHVNDNGTASKREGNSPVSQDIPQVREEK